MVGQVVGALVECVYSGAWAQKLAQDKTQICALFSEKYFCAKSPSSQMLTLAFNWVISFQSLLSNVNTLLF